MSIVYPSMKPLHFTPPPTPPEPATPRFVVSEAVKCQIASFWPTIGETIANGPKTKKGQKLFPAQAKPQLPVNTIPPPALKDDGSLRFPWAARMNQSSRKLFCATEPTYRLDGTPQVTIPSKVLRLGPENNEEYVVGQFHRCLSPPGGLIHAVLNRLWGRELVTLPSEDASTSPVTHSHEVFSSSCSQFDNNLLLLAAEKAVPTQSLNIMEDIPSHSLFLEDHRASETEQQIDLRSPLTLDHQPFSMEPETPLAYGKGTGFDVVGDSSSYTVTREEGQ
ncbi:hypothetical protein DY000_02054606 [Brassica cretica]|uniref:Uncharacterized protein n=1 Tax=Brassica cretica TaxID=69181 RepID=A0ABQ7ABK4_BRACR|nr:hypothetical protein DY000_02054606 [Brassica cretica]